MSDAPLDPTFVQAVQDALKDVSTRDLGPITRERPVADLGLDSVAFAELLIALEDKLDVTFEDSDLLTIKTFGDLHDLLKRVVKPADTPAT